MWKRLTDALLWAQALDRYSRTDFEKVVAKLDAIKGPRRRASEYFALLGTAHLALARPESGALFLIARWDTTPTRPEYQGYVYAYCDYYLAVIDENEGAVINSLEKALRIDAPPIIRRWLPLS